jgi:PAS domain S-box-containing protein
MNNPLFKEPVPDSGNLQAENEVLRAEIAALKIADQKLRELFRDINEVLYTVDMIKYRVINMSTVCVRIYGYEAIEFLSDPELWRNIVHPDDRHIPEKQLEDLYAGRQVVNRHRIIHKDGSIRWVENKVIPKLDQNGILYRLDGVTSDITEVKNTESELLERGHRYRILFEQNLAGIYRSNRDGKVLDCNLAFAKMLGYDDTTSFKELNASTHYYHQTGRNTFLEDIHALQSMDNYDVMLKHKNGDIVYVIENVFITTDPSTGEIFYDGIVIDVTKRKKAEQVLEQSRKRLEDAELLGDMGHWHWDLLTNRCHSSIGNLRLLGLSADSSNESIEKMFEHLHPGDLPGINNEIAKSIESGRIDNFQLRFIRPDGSIRHLVSTAKVIKNEKGEPISMFGINFDITRIKLTEDKLRQSEATLEAKNAELQLKNKELEQFAYITSHDLQEPIRTVASFAELLQEQQGPTTDITTKKYFDFIFSSIDRMKVLINDLLDYSRIGRKATVQEVDCNTVLKEVIDDLGTAISESGAQLQVSRLPVINGHATDIKQLFQNLIMNAIKFRKKDVAPVIQVKATESTGSWVFSVEDNGIGIEPQHKDRVFVIFQRLHTRTEYEGTGIGLAHCKKIVELHGGTIWLESELGTGSTFLFTLKNQYP